MKDQNQYRRRKDGIDINAGRIDGVICSGPRIGNQFSYAFLPERAGQQKILSNEEALIELAGRYFRSRGPATVQDLSYWSGIPQKDARQAVEGLNKDFRKMGWDGREFYFSVHQVAAPINTKASFLVPDYDEIGMSYKDKGAFSLRGRSATENAGPEAGLQHYFVVDGKVSGYWKTTLVKSKRKVETKPYTQLSDTGARKLQSAVKRYERFFNAGL